MQKWRRRGQDDQEVGDQDAQGPAAARSNRNYFIIYKLLFNTLSKKKKKKKESERRVRDRRERVHDQEDAHDPHLLAHHNHAQQHLAQVRDSR
jgi:hypothetical protein